MEQGQLLTKAHKPKHIESRIMKRESGCLLELLVCSMWDWIGEEG